MFLSGTFDRATKTGGHGAQIRVTRRGPSTRLPLRWHANRTRCAAQAATGTPARATVTVARALVSPLAARRRVRSQRARLWLAVGSSAQARVAALDRATRREPPGHDNEAGSAPVKGHPGRRPRGRLFDASATVSCVCRTVTGQDARVPAGALLRCRG
jgi:hypothetical protein